MPQPRNTLCLVVDRLHCGHLAAYGNAWIETPEFDRLAAESLVCDFAAGDAPDLAAACAALWRGRSPWPTKEPTKEHELAGEHVARLASAAGVATTLVSDDEAVYGHTLAAEFGEVIPYRFPVQTASAAEPGDTNLAQFFAAAGAALEACVDRKRPWHLWLHTQGLGHAWDAPRVLREQFLDEPDELPPEFVAPPTLLFPKKYDPDERLQIRRAYAAQVTLLDNCLGALADQLRALPADEQPLLVLTSPRGYALGEHHRVGDVDDRLYSELTHVPCVLRFPDGLGAATRTHALVQLNDVWATLADWWQNSAAGDVSTAVPLVGAGRSLLPIAAGDLPAWRDRVALRGRGGERAIETPAWRLRLSDSESELFVKPDDRWEVNPVENRCPEVAADLAAALDAFEQHIGQPEATLPPLSDVLRLGLA